MFKLEVLIGALQSSFNLLEVIIRAQFAQQFSRHRLAAILCFSIGDRPSERSTLHLFTPRTSLIDLQMLPPSFPLPSPLEKKRKTTQRERKSVIKIQVMYSCFWILFEKRY